jgi:hypothetical protein
LRISPVKKIIRQYIVAENLTNEEAAIRLGEKYDLNKSGKNLSLKINKGTIKFIEALQLLDVLGYDFKIEKRK